MCFLVHSVRYFFQHCFNGAKFSDFYSNEYESVCCNFLTLWILHNSKPSNIITKMFVDIENKLRKNLTSTCIHTHTLWMMLRGTNRSTFVEQWWCKCMKTIEANSWRFRLFIRFLYLSWNAHAAPAPALARLLAVWKSKARLIWFMCTSIIKCNIPHLLGATILLPSPSFRLCVHIHLMDGRIIFGRRRCFFFSLLRQWNRFAKAGDENNRAHKA